MARLAPQFSCNRMLRDYVDSYYLPAAAAFHRRIAEGGRVARALSAWADRLRHYWPGLHFGDLRVERRDGRLQFDLQVYLGELRPEEVRVELYADALGASPMLRAAMAADGAIPGSVNGYIYRAVLDEERPAEHFTPRIVPAHPEAMVPMECGLVAWHR
jgi:starch phosphorylase